MKLFPNTSNYDWATWLMGIMRAFIAAGAGAVASPTGPMILDPKDWNLGDGLSKVLMSMLIGFLVSGIVGMMIFLNTHSGPDRFQRALAVAAEATNAAAQNTARAGDAIATAQHAAAPKDQNDKG